MDSLSHVTLALFGGLGLRLKNRGLLYVSSLSIFSAMIDVDHLFVPLGLSTEFRTLHNVYLMVLLPLLMFLVSLIRERKTESDRYQTFFLTLLVMLSGHLVFDMVYTYVMIFYPLSDAYYGVPRLDLQLTEEFKSGIVQPIGIALLIYAGIVIAGGLLHGTLHHMKHVKKPVQRAFRAALRDYL